jgi:recX family
VEPEDFIAVLRPLLDSKRRTLKAATDYELNMKLIKFALGRGFDMETIRKCLTDVDEFAED